MMEKRFLLPCSLFVAGCLSLGAEEQNQMGNNCCPPKPCCTSVCCPEIIEDCCACDVCPPMNQVTPNAGPCVKNGSNLYAVVAFTYWTAHEDNLVIGNIKEPFTTAGTITSQTEQLQPNWKGRPGFKVGVGYDFCHDGWDAFLNYTWFRSNNNSVSETPSNGQIIDDDYWLVNGGLFPQVGFVTPFQNASAKWTMHLNVIDFELGRNFYISRRIQLRPHFGLKGMWYKQDFDLEFRSIPGGVSTFNNSMTAKMKNWGVGARAGLDTAWHFCRDFSFIGEIAVTALWEHFKTTRVDETFSIVSSATAGPAGTLTSLVNYKNHYYTLKPVVEWMVGLRWEMWTCCDEYHFAFDAGWEAQHWFSQNKFIRGLATDTANGDLAFYGSYFKSPF